MSINVHLKIDGSSGDEMLETAIANRLAEYFELWKLKQKGYGPGNIAKAGEHGVAIRVQDKVERMLTLIRQSLDTVNAESRRDTWLDILGYGVIGLALFDGVWPMPTEQRVEETKFSRSVVVAWLRRLFKEDEADLMIDMLEVFNDCFG